MLQVLLRTHVPEAGVEIADDVLACVVFWSRVGTRVEEVVVKVSVSSVDSFEVDWLVFLDDPAL